MLRYIRPVCFVLGLVILVSSLVLPSAAAYPSVSGECACLYLPQSQTVIYGKNETKRHAMASTTKIMTALVALKYTHPSDVVCISPAATGIEGSSIYLKPGERLTMESLLYAMLLESANDAAAAIAIHVAGSISAFADLMNTHAHDLELSDTHFTNPHGLFHEEHYTTALDLAKIAAAAMEHPTFYQIASTKHKIISDLDDTTQRTLTNHNRLLRSYDDCVGVKTGFTKKSGRCLVSAAERNGMLLIAVTLDAANDWQDHTAMLDYGFSQYEGQQPLHGKNVTFTVPVIGGTKEEVAIAARNLPTIILKRGTPPLDMNIEMNRFAVAPIRRGDVLGLIRYTQGDKTVATVPLLANESIQKIEMKQSLWDKIKHFWNG